MDSATTPATRYLLLGMAFGVGVLAFILTSGSASKSHLNVTASHEETPVEVVADEPVHRAAVMLPAPAGETQPRENAKAPPAPPPIEFRVFCSPTAFRFIGRPLELAFEDQERGVDVILEKHTDRDCVGHLMMGNADVVLISDALSQSEKARQLTDRVIAHRIVVPVLHPSNPLDSIHDSDLEAILHGKLTSWRTAGGSDLDVLPVCQKFVRRTDEASRQLRVHHGAENTAVFLDTPAEILAFVSNDPRAIGLVDLVHATAVRNVKMLEVNHVKPTHQAMARGAWPIGTSIRAVSHPDADVLAQTFLTFLESATAKRVLSRQFTLPK